MQRMHVTNEHTDIHCTPAGPLERVAWDVHLSRFAKSTFGGSKPDLTFKM